MFKCQAILEHVTKVFCNNLFSYVIIFDLLTLGFTAPETIDGFVFNYYIVPYLPPYNTASDPDSVVCSKTAFAFTICLNQTTSQKFQKLAGYTSDATHENSRH
jgi:hypothetical protein